MISLNKPIIGLIACAALSGCGSSDSNTENLHGGVEELILALAKSNQVSTDTLDGTWLVTGHSVANSENSQNITDISTILTIDSNNGLTMAMCSNGEGTSGSDTNYTSSGSASRKLIVSPDTEVTENDSSVFNMPYEIIGAVFSNDTLGEGGNYQANIDTNNSIIRFHNEAINLSDGTTMNATMTLYKFRDEQHGAVGKLDWHISDSLNGQPDLYCFRYSTVQYSGSGDANVIDSQYDITTFLKVSDDLSDGSGVGVESLWIEEYKEFNDNAEINQTRKNATFTRGNGNVSKARLVTPDYPEPISYGQYDITSSQDNSLQHAGSGSITGQGGEVVTLHSYTIDLTVGSESQENQDVVLTTM